MSKSARALREAEDLYGTVARTPSWRAAPEPKPDEHPERRSGFGSIVFVALAIVVVIMAATQLPMNGPSPSAVSALPINAAAHQSKFGQFFSNLIQAKTSRSLREDFQAGIGNWEGGKIGSDWAIQPGRVRPSSLRLWKQSTSLGNYDMEFMGQIEQKSIDWAFRAPDAKNYYGTKLMITKSAKGGPNAGLVRFIVLDGRERERVELPLPLTLEAHVDYQVHVSVRGEHFLTSVNGQLVSSWSDNRLSRGGIGFFSEDGESALLKWVSLSDRDNVFSRFASYFSLIVFPTAPSF